jgi:hypothetical protein
MPRKMSNFGEKDQEIRKIIYFSIDDELNYKAIRYINKLTRRYSIIITWLKVSDM